MLPYARQVLELEKVAALEQGEAAPCEPSPLRAATERDGTCLVCERPAAGVCALCEVALYCSREHQSVDAPWHGAVCARQLEIREDEAFLERTGPLLLASRLLELRAARRSRDLPSSWEDYFAEIAVRESPERRLFADLASRPLTLARALSDLGLLAAGGSGTLRVHVMAASQKEHEAPSLYAELQRAFPAARFELGFVGPELPALAVEDLERVHFRLRSGAYRRALWSELGRPDCIVAFDAGLLVYPSWKETLLELRGTEIPLLLTSYRSWEARAESSLLESLGAVSVAAPARNPFASLAWRRSTTIANDVTQDNAFVSAWRF